MNLVQFQNRETHIAPSAQLEAFSSQLADSSDELIETLGPVMIKELADARVELAKGRSVSAEDERRFAASWLRRRIERIQSDRLSTGVPKLDQNEVSDLSEFVIDTAFNGSRLWRVFQQYDQACNMWVQGSSAVKIELADGRIITAPPVAKNDSELRQAVRALRAKSTTPDEPWDRSNHALEFVVEHDGTRVTAIDHVTTSQVFVTLRRPTYVRVTLEDLTANETMSPSCARLLQACVRSGQRILIGGSMNTGKTVLLRALAAAIPKDWITVTVESQAELLISEHPGELYPNFVVSMQARKPGADGNAGVSLNRLIEDAQRMSPKCVIVGEVRGVEVNALSKSLLQGYQVLSTIHAASARHALDTASLYLEQFSDMSSSAALRRIATGIDVIVFMENIAGKRIVSEVVWVGDSHDGLLQIDHLVNHSETGSEVVPHLPNALERSFERNGIDPVEIFLAQRPESGSLRTVGTARSAGVL